MYKTKRLLALTLALFLSLACAACSQDSIQETPPPVQQPEGLLTVNYIDVGQGDSILIQLPDQRTMLIDAGEAEYGPTVIQHIESLGITDLDYVIATHPHSDHIGGLPAVLEHFSAGEIYMPKVQNNTQIFEKLLTVIQNKSMKIKEARAGVTILNEDGLQAVFTAPQKDSYSDLNNYSAVLRVTWGGTSFLFTGDAEDISEREMLAALPPEQLQSQVLKVGHHGSAYSSTQEFLAAVAPSYAVISCGTGNKYNHPEPAALSRLQAAGTEIVRTDLEGTIVVTSDGREISASVSAPQTAPPVPGPTASPATVYVTPSGKSYHLEGCQYLKSSAAALSLEDARSSYSPCKKCSPPK